MWAERTSRTRQVSFNYSFDTDTFLGITQEKKLLSIINNDMNITFRIMSYLIDESEQLNVLHSSLLGACKVVASHCLMLVKMWYPINIYEKQTQLAANFILFIYLIAEYEKDCNAKCTKCKKTIPVVRLFFLLIFFCFFFARSAGLESIGGLWILHQAWLRFTITVVQFVVEILNGWHSCIFNDLFPYLEYFELGKLALPVHIKYIHSLWSLMLLS